MKKTLLSLLAAVVLAGCAGTPPQTTYYVLRADPPAENRQLNPSRRFAMAGVQVAAYIDQPGVVMEDVPGEVRPARFHQWAEPLSEALRNFLLVEVSRELGEDVFPASVSNAATTFGVRIGELHGNAAGEATLTAYWWIRRGGEVLASYEFHQKRPLAADGYLALTRAQRALLSELSEQIAASLLANEPS